MKEVQTWWLICGAAIDEPTECEAPHKRLQSAKNRCLRRIVDVISARRVRHSKQWVGGARQSDGRSRRHLHPAQQLFAAGRLQNVAEGHAHQVRRQTVQRVHINDVRWGNSRFSSNKNTWYINFCASIHYSRIKLTTFRRKETSRAGYLAQLHIWLRSKPPMLQQLSQNPAWGTSKRPEWWMVTWDTCAYPWPVDETEGSTVNFTKD